MKNQKLLMAGVLPAFGLILAALPSHSATPQQKENSFDCTQVINLERVPALLDDKGELADLAQVRALQESARTLVRQAPLLLSDDDDVSVYLSGDEGPSWLGVETQEVTSDKAKGLKLPSERGVVIGRIVPDSPAAKAGLKEDDVVTEVNGQRVEGTVQFRRMIREIPSGRTAQLTVWRDAHSQILSVTLGKAEEGPRVRVGPAPGRFSFHVKELPDTIEIPEMPQMDWGGMLMPGMRPGLGIDAEDLSGQLGSYFAAPEGEGVLVREVNSGSPAEKAGLKAGDVITKLNDERIRTVGDLREKLSAKRDDKTVKLGIIRNRSEMNLTVELPPPQEKVKRLTLRGTKI
jgi:serine protease Do